MTLHERTLNHFASSIQIQQDSMDGLSELIGLASERLVHALLSDKKILACGNGGAATNAQLLVSAMINRFERDRPPLPAIALGAVATTLTAIAADTHFDDIFAKQLRALGQSGDILVVYATGEYSANLVKAIMSAHDKDIAVLALTGQNSANISALLYDNDLELRVPSNLCARITETHLLITHCLCDLIDYQIFGG